jgi:hypothetical protein
MDLKEVNLNHHSMWGKKKDFPISCLYVDDLIYVGTSKDMVVEFKNAMMKKFKMSNLGLMILGIQVKQSLGKIFIS